MREGHRKREIGGGRELEIIWELETDIVVEAIRSVKSSRHLLLFHTHYRILLQANKGCSSIFHVIMIAITGTILLFITVVYLPKQTAAAMIYWEDEARLALSASFTISKLMVSIFRFLFFFFSWNAFKKKF